MSNATSVLRELIAMSAELGRPERDLVILGEGNTSAACDDGSYWVKASGTQLRMPSEDTFVRLWCEPVCALAGTESMSDDAVKGALDEAKVDPGVTKRSSTETVLHALALTEGGASFVGHTHPIAVNAIMCSASAAEAVSGRIFPDEIVVCGPAPAYVPYADPGLPLARAVREVLREYIDEWNTPPKVVVLQNHGLIAMGSSPTEVDSITSMFVKTCRVLAGTRSFGGPHYLEAKHVNRIYTRPDEVYRRRELQLEKD